MTWTQSIGAIVAMSAVIWIVQGSPPRTSEADRASARQGAEMAAMDPERLRQFQQALQPPEVQAAFMRAVAVGQQQFAAAAGDEFRQGATRPTRKAAICNLGVDRQPVQGWVGQVTTRTTNGDGKGVLSITLPGGAVVSTWNNALSDIGDRTLVEPGSPVFEAMGTMQNGDHVRFSGRFARSEADCVREASMTLGGSMNSPRFVFRFDSVEVIRP